MLVTGNNDVCREVERRVVTAIRAFYGQSNQLRSRKLQTQESRNLGSTVWTIVKKTYPNIYRNDFYKIFSFSSCFHSSLNKSQYFRNRFLHDLDLELE